MTPIHIPARESEDDDRLGHFGYACLRLEGEAAKGADCDSLEEARQILRELQELMECVQDTLEEARHHG